MRYTIVVEWPDGQEPRLSASDTFKGGRCCAVQFSDALQELEAIYDGMSLDEASRHDFTRARQK